MEKGKYKGECGLSLYINLTTKHIAIARHVDIEMADPDPQLMATATPSHDTAACDLGAWLEELEQSLYDQ